MNDVVVLKRNTKFNKGLVMPQEGTYLELDQDEMEYVDGGGKIGTYSYRDNTGVKWLADAAAGWFVTCGIWLADTLMCAALAAATSPSVAGGIICGCLGTICGLVSGISFGLGQAAANAMHDAIYAMECKKNYTVYENKFLFIVTGYSVRC